MCITGSSFSQKMLPLLSTSRKRLCGAQGRVKCGILTLHMLRSQHPDLRRNKSYNPIKRCKCVVFCGFCGRNTPLLFSIFLSSPQVFFQRSWQSFDSIFFFLFVLDFLSPFSLDFFESFLFWTFFCPFFLSIVFIIMTSLFFYETLVKRDQEFSWRFLFVWMDEICLC